MTYRVLSLFAGIGGFDLGLERTGGFKTVAFCEIDAAAQRVLRKHWPEVPVYGDVRELTADQLRADGIIPDVICGGFPCQDISTAGAGAGIEGKRSGLWGEIARLAGDVRPAYIIVENVAALLSRGLDKVLGDLASLGYDAEWHCIPAFAVGAPHRRDRIWIIAYPNPDHARLEGRNGNSLPERPGEQPVRPLGASLAHTERAGLAGGAGCGMPRTRGAPILAPRIAQGLGGQWHPEPAVGRVANGIPNRVDRLKQLGNAVVPQIPELIGRAILEAEAA